jgi:hypothetical protein
MNLETQIKATEALNFLRDHPALNNDGGDSLFNGAWFHMALCCKHGTSKYAGTDGIEVYKSDPNWKKYKEYFKDDDDEACVPYEVIHGEPWKAHHMEYWYEICFMIFEGNPYDRDDTYKFEKWGRYGGPEGGANSFEEMLIKAATEVKEAFGDFNSYDSFLTKAVTNNHKNVIPMTHEPLKDKPEYGLCVFNKDYVDIGQGLINLRWLKWFIATDYAKKNWEHSITKWQTYIDKIEKLESTERKQILEKFK